MRIAHNKIHDLEGMQTQGSQLIIWSQFLSRSILDLNIRDVYYLVTFLIAMENNILQLLEIL